MAALLVRKATSDLAAARVLATDADQTDDIVGFHVQAVEKAIKAALTMNGAEVPRTHELSYLLVVNRPAGGTDSRSPSPRAD